MLHCLKGFLKHLAKTLWSRVNDLSLEVALNLKATKLPTEKDHLLSSFKFVNLMLARFHLFHTRIPQNGNKLSLMETTLGCQPIRGHFKKANRDVHSFGNEWKPEPNGPLFIKAPTLRGKTHSRKEEEHWIHFCFPPGRAVTVHERGYPEVTGTR